MPEHLLDEIKRRIKISSKVIECSLDCLESAIIIPRVICKVVCSSQDGILAGEEVFLQQCR